MALRQLLLPAVLLTACGGSPTAPAPGGGLPFREATYSINFIGDSFACGDLKNPQAGTVVTVRVSLQAKSNGWIGTSEGGGLTVQFQPVQTEPMFSVGLAGTLNGSADDQGPGPGGITIPPNGTRLTVDPPVPLTGGMPSATISDFALGTVNGAVVFSRGSVASTCPAGGVRWTLNRVP